MNTLYDLVKRIDALTANSQQVLNALIRSCIATGSSSGYTVRKFGQDIKLDRADIYRLYDFYNTWENAQFPSDDRFDVLLDKANTRWHKGEDDQSTPVTSVVVKHSKILYMSADNQTINDDKFWTDKIKESASGKSVVSTAPIPINLRTPLYDENLSVKSFNQYETYLFPMGYRRTEILGTPGNGDDYVAGGKTWEIGVSDFLRLSSDKHITIGQIPTNDLILDNYGDSRNTLSWGFHSYAFSDFSLAAGYKSIAHGENSFAIGYNALTYAPQSFSCGTGTITAGNISFAINEGTKAGGEASIAANHGTHTGGYPYSFTARQTVVEASAVQINCGDAVLSGNVCTVETNTTGATTALTQTDVLVVRIEAQYRNVIPFELKSGDKVYIYGIKGTVNGINKYPGEDGAYNYAADVRIIDWIEDPNPVGTSIEYLIHLRGGLTSNNWMLPREGYIQLASRGISPYSTPQFGLYSNAFNENTWARGRAQTVVGTSNEPDDTARFIVGTGSRGLYMISNDEETHGSRHRSNGLAIAPLYGYMKLYDSNGGFSVSKDATVLDNFQILPGAVMRYGSNDNHNRVESFDTHSLMMSVASGEPTAIIGTANDDDTVLCKFPQGMSNWQRPNKVTSAVTSRNGLSILSSGYTAEELGTHIYNRWKSSPAGEATKYKICANDDVGIYATGVIDIGTADDDTNSSIQITTAGDLEMKFGHILLSGDTMGTLTASDKARSLFISGQDIIEPCYAETSTYSGFYWSELHASTNSAYYKRTAARIYGEETMAGDQIIHQICSTTTPSMVQLYATETDKMYNTVSLVMQSGIVGSNPNFSDQKIWNPRITSVRYRNQWDRNPRIVYSHELAVMENLYQMCPMSYGHAAAYGYNYDTDAMHPGQEHRTTLVMHEDTSSIECKIPVCHIYKDGNKYYHEMDAEEGTGHVLRFRNVNKACTSEFNIYRKNTRNSMTENRALLAEVRNFTYMLCGRFLKISFYLYQAQYNEPIGGYIIPVYLGCAIEPLDYYVNADLTTDMTQSVNKGCAGLNGTWNKTYKVGEEDYTRWDFKPSNQARGTVYTNGLVVCEFHESGGDDKLTGDTWYHVVLEGIAPFVPKSQSCGMSMTTAWETALKEQYGAKDYAFDLPNLYWAMPKLSSRLA